MNDQVIIGYISAGNPELAFVSAINRLIGDLSNRVVGTLAIQSGPKIDKGRNKLFETWLDETDADYLFMVDDDMIPPPYAITRLMGHRKDIIGALVFSQGLAGEVKPVIHVAREVEDGGALIDILYDYPQDQVIPVVGTGGAAMLITRRCAKAVKEAMGDHPSPWFAFGMHNGVEVGEDIAFCMRAAKVGFQTWVDTGLEVPHIKKHTVGEVEYVRALMSESHPYYDLRETVPIYQELTNANTSIDGSEPSYERVPGSS